MIKHEKIYPEKIAYDRPSEKLLNFLKKYYNLRNYLPQNNNFVIYNEYFYSDNTLNKNELNYQQNSNFNENYSNYSNDNDNTYNYTKKPNKCMIPTNSKNNFSSGIRGK